MLSILQLDKTHMSPFWSKIRHSQSLVAGLVTLFWGIFWNLAELMIHQTQCSQASLFTVCTKLAEMALLYSKELTTAKKSYLQWDST